MGCMAVVVVVFVVVVVVVVIVIIIIINVSTSSSHHLFVLIASRIAWNFISMPSVHLCDLIVVHVDTYINVDEFNQCFAIHNTVILLR
jgi:hypothetical protein